MSFGYQVLGFGVGPAGEAVYDVEYLIVAGGGSGGRGGRSGFGGAGGAGGYRTNYGGTVISLTEGVEYTVTVGGGAAAYGPSQQGISGANSSLAGSSC